MAIDNDLLIRVIDAAEEDSYGSDYNDELAQSRAAALDAYLGANIDPAPEGRSQVVDRTLFETVESVIPSLVRIFASGDDVCKVLPVGPDDHDAAEQTTALLQWVVTEKNPWEQIVHDWAKDALLLRNGYTLAYWDNSKRIEREQYEGQSDEQLALLMQDDNVTVLQHSQRPDTATDERNAAQYQQAMQQYQQQLVQMQQQMAAQPPQPGQPPPQMPPPPQAPQPAFLHDVVIERASGDGKVKICVLPPEHCKVATSTPDFTLRDCPYFEFWEERTISDLRAMGLDVPDDIGDGGDEDDGEEDRARDRFSEDWRDTENHADPSMRRVRARMIWVRADLEGDGVARLYYVIRVGREILYVEPCSRIPVASITPMPMPHRHIGLSYYDVLADIQDIKTAVHRGALDNLYLSVNGRHVVSDAVNLDDLLAVRPGGVVRMRPGALPGEGHVLPLQHPFAFDQILGAVSYFDQIKQSRSGVNDYFNGVDENALNRTASGLAQMTTQSAQRVEQIARMFATGVEYLFSVVLELIQKHSNKEQTFSLRGKWYAVDPRAWSTRRDLKISVGVGAGNKDAMLAQLNQIVAQQMQVGIPLGIANPQNVYHANAEIAKLQGFAQPDRFWTDPSTAPPPGPPPPDPLVQAEQIKAQAMLQGKQLEAQTDAQTAQMDAQIKQGEIQMKAQADALEAQRKMELERERIVAESQAKIEVARIQAQIDLEKAIAVEQIRQGSQVQMHEREGKGAETVGQVQQVVAALQDLQTTVQALAQEMARRSSGQIVRDKAGRVAGMVDAQGAPISVVQRDAGGRVVGIAPAGVQ